MTQFNKDEGVSACGASSKWSSLFPILDNSNLFQHFKYWIAVLETKPSCQVYRHSRMNICFIPKHKIDCIFLAKLLLQFIFQAECSGRALPMFQRVFELVFVNVLAEACSVDESSVVAIK